MEMFHTKDCLHSVYTHEHITVHPVLLPFMPLLVLNIHALLPLEQKQVKACLLKTVFVTKSKNIRAESHTTLSNFLTQVNIKQQEQQQLLLRRPRDQHIYMVTKH